MDIKQKLADLEMYLCQCSDREERRAESAALKVLLGDTKARDGVFTSIGIVEGYKVAMQKITELRVEAERA